MLHFVSVFRALRGVILILRYYPINIRISIATTLHLCKLQDSLMIPHWYLQNSIQNIHPRYLLK